MKKGFLVTFEGGEACGKSTLIKTFVHYLEENKIDYVLSREPGGTPIAEECRKILASTKSDISTKTELLLVSAGRADHVEKVIKPNLDAGKVVVLDRYFDSAYAHQGHTSKDVSYQDVKDITAFVVGDAVPDLTILLDIKYEDSMKRKMADEKLKELDRFELKAKEYHDKVRQGYLNIAEEFKDRYFVIDAMKSKQEIFEETIKEFEKRYKKQ